MKIKQNSIIFCFICRMQIYACADADASAGTGAGAGATWWQG